MHPWRPVPRPSSVERQTSIHPPTCRPPQTHMFPVSGALQLHASAARGDQPITSHNGAYSALVSRGREGPTTRSGPSPASTLAAVSCRSGGSQQFHSPNSCARRFNRSMTGGTLANPCLRACAAYSASAGSTCSDTNRLAASNSASACSDGRGMSGGGGEASNAMAIEKTLFSLLSADSRRLMRLDAINATDQADSIDWSEGGGQAAEIARPGASLHDDAMAGLLKPPPPPPPPPPTRSPPPPHSHADTGGRTLSRRSSAKRGSAKAAACMAWL